MIHVGLIRNLSALCIGLLLALTLAPLQARAASFDEALAKFAADSFPDTQEAIADLAASGHPRASVVIEALRDANLLFDPQTNRIYIREGNRTLDAATGQPAVAPDTVDNVRINNRLRQLIAATLGGMTLTSPDRARRLEAARSVFRSLDLSLLPAVETALAKESDATVRRALADARAAILLTERRAAEPLLIEAVEQLKSRRDRATLNLLNRAAADTPEAVRTAARSAVAAIEQQLAFAAIMQNVWYGLSLGSVLALAAIGLAITFGVMGVINMAHGEMVMIGAYVTFVLQELIRNYRPELFDYSLAMALPLAFLVSGAVGVGIERTVIRFLYKRPLETLLATWGISLILQQAVRTLFGPTNREVGNPSWMSGAFDLGGMTVTYSRMWIVLFTLAVFVALLAMLRLSRFGLEMRAVTQNRAMAASMGIRTSRVDALTFGLGSGIAGIAGVALSQIDNVSPNLGQSYIIDSFMVVVFGGVGNLWGTLVGAFTLGIANKFLEPYAGAVLAKIAILVFIILFIQKHPRGMFALKGRAAEA